MASAGYQHVDHCLIRFCFWYNLSVNIRDIRHGAACTCLACALAGALNFGDRVAWLPEAYSSDHLPEQNFAYTMVQESSIVTNPNTSTIVSSMFPPS